MQQHSHNVAILAEIEKSKHVKNENDKREIADHESSADNDKKRNKNQDQKERDEKVTHTTQAIQETHTMNLQIIEILKLLFMKTQIIFEQKVIEQQMLLYSLFIQML